jgi:hypothetical protein
MDRGIATCQIKSRLIATVSRRLFGPVSAVAMLVALTEDLLILRLIITLLNRLADVRVLAANH